MNYQDTLERNKAFAAIGSTWRFVHSNKSGESKVVCEVCRVGSSVPYADADGLTEEEACIAALAKAKEMGGPPSDALDVAAMKKRSDAEIAKKDAEIAELKKMIDAAKADSKPGRKSAAASSN